MLTISIGESRKSTVWTPKEVTWDQLVHKLSTPVRTQETMEEWAAMTKDQRAAVKDVGGYVGGRIEGGARKAGSITDRQIVCLDADFADSSIYDVWDLMVGKACVMHSSHSHTEETPRFRFVIPLSRAVTAAEYEPIARRLAQWVGIDFFDDTTYEASRLMYWPSCSADADYVCRVCEGEWVDPDAVLATYDDWHDMSLWPTSSRQMQVIAKMGAVQGDPLTKPGVIGAFNRAYTITEAILSYLQGVYVPAGANRWTYVEGTTTGGAVTYDEDTFIYSHHDTDPISRRLCNAFDMVRLHKFAHLDEGSDASIGELPSMAAMKALCSQDEAVRAQLADAALQQKPGEVFAPDDGLQRFAGDLTEQGLATRFADMYGEGLRYNKALGWLYWDGVRWVTDAEAEASMLIFRFTDQLYSGARMHMQLATEKEDQAQAKAEMMMAMKLRSASGINHLVGLARVLLNDPDACHYDAQAWLLNTPDGLVDLRTGDIMAHDPKVFATKCTAVSMGSAGWDQWLAFINHITGGDEDFALYLQTLAGMAAVGQVYEEGLITAYGPGGNGKSTFFGAVGNVLGDYARTVNADILVTASGQTDSSYIAALRGARLAIMGETEEGAHLSVATMKRITSRDVISARSLYKDPIEFIPTHTTIMHTNHLPRLGSMDSGTKRRIAVAPFPAVLPPERVITDYCAVLVRECGGAILKWIVDGAIRFYRLGCKLEKPDVVRQATEKYIAEEDWLRMFLEDVCVTETDDHEKALTVTCTGSDLYAAYQRWANANGAYVRRARDLCNALEARGFERVRAKTARKWIGIAIREDAETL